MWWNILWFFIGTMFGFTVCALVSVNREEEMEKEYTFEEGKPSIQSKDSTVDV